MPRKKMKKITVTLQADHAALLAKLIDALEAKTSPFPILSLESRVETGKLSTAVKVFRAILNEALRIQVGPEEAQEALASPRPGPRGRAKVPWKPERSQAFMEAFKKNYGMK